MQPVGQSMVNLPDAILRGVALLVNGDLVMQRASLGHLEIVDPRQSVTSADQNIASMLLSKNKKSELSLSLLDQDVLHLFCDPFNGLKGGNKVSSVSNPPPLFHISLSLSINPDFSPRFLLLLHRTEHHCRQSSSSGHSGPKVRFFVKHLKEMIKNMETHPQ